MKDKSHTIYEVMEIIKNNKDVIFEIRDSKWKQDWYEHMLLISVHGITGGCFLNYYIKPVNGVEPYKWRIEKGIPLSENIKWYVSSLTKDDIQSSINEIGLRDN
ncbi:hypothetical protein FDC58_10545 [Clostridium botulinum]|nr:hypothetical protein [Clostridium botulinum]NFO86479.1 hypothetical protein [Clostridium botulinum]NFP29676.1 hypothetical protein [Clostridium botulinum]